MGIWVDTDFGFDDLWAILVLAAEDVVIDGVSLVAGNAPLQQVVQNALGAKNVFNADWHLYAGASKPLLRTPETAERILGPSGMKSRGLHLPKLPEQALRPFEPAIKNWLSTDQVRHDVLALGPLTNLAHLHQAAPESFAKIDRVVWMGGSAGKGNHSPYAEFNALADPEAVAQVLASGVKVDIVDLEICRSVTFGEGDFPVDLTPLLADLLGGYLDIGLSRGRKKMAIYDPLAALALACSECLGFVPVEVDVELTSVDEYGKTTLSPLDGGLVRLAINSTPNAAERCLNALRKASK